MSDLRDLLIKEESDDSSTMVSGEEVDEGQLFGLNAIERMFLSFGLFMVVVVISVLLLILTSSIDI